jgi:hypothetical protein
VTTKQLMRQAALLEHAAHCSTQHNDEHLVNAEVMMASAGENEIVAGIFAVASNDFMTEFCDVVEPEGSDANEEEIKDGPTMWKQGNHLGKKKLRDSNKL